MEQVTELHKGRGTRKRAWFKAGDKGQRPRPVSWRKRKPEQVRNRACPVGAGSGAYTGDRQAGLPYGAVIF